MSIQMLNGSSRTQQNGSAKKTQNKNPFAAAFTGVNKPQGQAPGGFGKMQMTNGSQGFRPPGSFSVGGPSGTNGNTNKANNNNANSYGGGSQFASNLMNGANGANGNNPSFQGAVGDMNANGTPTWDASMELTPGFNAANPGSFAGINGSGDDKFEESMEDKLDKLTENREDAEEKAKEDAEEAKNKK